ncbi:hypothetical protein GCM10011506_17440 [Marivirga lumbricoides]|uniref:DUF3823 domain-containing protein n=2 Tax=Marivirga lumbricoides TaxID=1046115 RepID=A0ABQ1M3G0_9BACT|nr:hypothetical protein GCM10011506_17440 [Marivirga lumbricoides]
MRYNIKYKKAQVILSAPLILLAFILTGCPEPPEFDNTPRIAFESLQFETRTDPDQPNITEDVLSLKLYFEDGDGDLGLRSDEIFDQYRPFFWQKNDENKLIRLNSIDTLPPYNPLDYFTVLEEDDTVIVENELITIADTLYIKRNPRHYNIFIKTFYKPGNEFIEYKWEEAPYYQTFNGRFPILNTEDYDRPINGTLDYDITSLGFRIIFRNYPMFVQAQIWDRAGNKSNIINSDTIQIIQ